MLIALKKNLLPTIYSIFLINAALFAFTNSFVSFIMPTLLLVTLTFLFCDYAISLKKWGSMIYFIATIVIFTLIHFINLSLVEDISFFYWIFTGSFVEEQFPYFLSFFLLSTFFIGSSVYFFTFVAFKFHYHILLILFPFVINSVKQVPMKPYILTGIIISFLILVVYLENVYYGRNNYNEENNTGNGKKNKKNFYMGVISFVLILTIITFVSSLIFVKNFRSRNFNNTNLGQLDIPQFIDKQPYSGDKGKGANRNILLFTLHAKKPTYLLTQVFDNYNSVHGYWKAYDGSDETDEFDWATHYSHLNLNTFFTNLDTGYDNIFKNTNIKPSLNDIINLKDIDNTYTSTITNKIKTSYLLAPARTYLITVNKGDFSYRRTINGDFETFDGNEIIQIDNEYSFTHYDDDVLKDNQGLINFVNQYSLESYEDLLNILNSDEVISVPEYDEEFAKHLKLEYEMAKEYENRTVIARSDELEALAYELTRNLTSDYEKAVAIEKHFHSKSYKYDLEYDPPKDREDIEYFVFESKTGTCSDYATAMTLIARYAGLNARYVGGFISHEELEPERFVIRSGNSHAFTQVFIPIYGWVNFDATPPSYLKNYKHFNKIKLPTNITFIFYILSAIITTAFLGRLIYKYIIKELVFRKRLEKENDKVATLIIYYKSLSLIEGTFKTYNLSTEMLVEIASANYNTDLSLIGYLFDKREFNNESITSSERNEAYKVYKKLYILWVINPKSQNIKFNRLNFE